MQAGIDITSLIYDRGVSRYTANLIRGLLAYTPVNLWLYGSSLRQHELLKRKARNLLGHEQRTVIQHYPPSILGKLWQWHLNPIKSQLPQVEVFHSWDYLQPPDPKLPLVSTVHDLAILRFPDSAHSNILTAHQRSWKILAERNCQIIAPSQSTKNDIVKYLQIPEFKIHVIPEALPEEMRRLANKMTDEDYDQIKFNLKLDKPFLLAVGVREPRKNFARLFEAWQEFGQDYELIVAGSQGWDEVTNRGKYQPRFLGHVSSRELSVLYSECVLFAYPSLYEGFGLPILEAFYHATPVLTSNNSGMLEVAGNAAALVNPEDVKDIARGIAKLLNETQEEKEKRTQRMIIRQQMFSWERTAKETYQVYQKAIRDWQ